MPSRQLHTKYERSFWTPEERDQMDDTLTEDILAKTGWTKTPDTVVTPPEYQGSADQSIAYQKSRDTHSEDYGRDPALIEQGFNPKADPRKALNMGTLAVGSLPEDPKSRIDYYARSAMPDLYKKDPKAARDRFGVKDGRYYYIPQNETQAYWVALTADENGPRGPGGPAAITDAITGHILDPRAGSQVAAGVGPAIPTAGGIAAGAVTMEGGPGASIAAAGAGQAGAEQLRQTLAQLLTGQDRTAQEQIGADVGQGVRGAVGQAAGIYGGRAVAALAKPLVKRIPGHPGYDLTFDPNLAKQAQSKAFAISDPKNPVNLWPAMASNDPRLKELTSGALATNEAINVSQAAMGKMNASVRSAVELYLKDLSGTTSAHSAARSGARGAQGVLGKLNEERGAAYRAPLDQAKAAGATADITPFLKDLQDAVAPQNKARTSIQTNKALFGSTPIGASAEDAAGLLGDSFGGAGWSARSVPVERIEHFKKGLDDLIDKASRRSDNLGSQQYAELIALKKRFTETVDPQIPAYAQAREGYAKLSGPYDRLQEGPVGDLAKVDEQDAFRAMKSIFNPENSSPEDIAAAREAFTANGQEQGWRDLVKGYLQNEFEKAAKEPSGQLYNLGAAFRQNVIGNDRKRNMLIAALDGNPQLLQRMNFLIDTMDAISRVQAPSRDVWARQAADEFARYVRTNPGTRVVDLYSNVAGVVTGAKSISEAAARGLSEASQARTARKLAEKLTDPNALTWFPEVYQMSPRSALAMALVGQIMTQGASQDQDPDHAAPVLPRGGVLR